MSLNDTNEKFELLENTTKHKLNPNDANVYDALWIAALTENISENTTFVELKNNFNKIIDSYQGASGNVKLDSYGDRIGNYDLWMIKENVVTKDVNKDYEWEKITKNTSNKSLSNYLLLIGNIHSYYRHLERILLFPIRE